MSPARAEAPLRVAVVVQRYGEGVNGGAETLCRSWVRRLSQRPEIGAIRVFTTCARDHLTWANHFAPGESQVDGVMVERHAVRFPRLRRLQGLAWRALHSPLRAPWLERLWLAAQGPYAPTLVQRISEVCEDWDAFMFVTYLYHPTVRGLAVVSERALLVPTAHREPAIELPMFRGLFAAARAVGCLTPEERAFVVERFPRQGSRVEVIGSGLEALPPPQELAGPLTALQGKPFVLYVGRVESDKGVPEVIRGFDAFRRQHAERRFERAGGGAWPGSDLRLVLVGRVGMELPNDPGIVATGFLDEGSKHALLEACELLVVPSRFESLSLVLLEGWQHGRAALVNAECDVTSGHLERSHGGLACKGAAGFTQGFEQLLGDVELRRRSGESGRVYVEREYTWPAVETRLIELLQAVAAR